MKEILTVKEFDRIVDELRRFPEADYAKNAERLSFHDDALRADARNMARYIHSLKRPYDAWHSEELADTVLRHTPLKR